MLIPIPQTLRRTTRAALSDIGRDADPRIAVRTENALRVEHARVRVLREERRARFSRARRALVRITICRPVSRYPISVLVIDGLLSPVKSVLFCISRFHVERERDSEDTHHICFDPSPEVR